ncbi:hypothetical protein TSAR_004535 [Trichomalopsis sarcophagae]|uniref:Uncharacterized protein n=1 Tax=Trichomalopsis sarcophagae TaxID=543379 RepID=A0A232EMG0_9HYME|nr:hypothetical protein TSAR_004535 [Trichomalopsis sarcophagae]
MRYLHGEQHVVTQISKDSTSSNSKDLLRNILEGRYFNLNLESSAITLLEVHVACKIDSVFESVVDLDLETIRLKVQNVWKIMNQQSALYGGGGQGATPENLAILAK